MDASVLTYFLKRKNSMSSQAQIEAKRGLFADSHDAADQLDKCRCELKKYPENDELIPVLEDAAILVRELVDEVEKARTVLSKVGRKESGYNTEVAKLLITWDKTL